MIPFILFAVLLAIFAAAWAVDWPVDEVLDSQRTVKEPYDSNFAWLADERVKGNR